MVSVWLLSVIIVYLLVIMKRHLWRQYPSIKGNKIYSNLTFATPVLLILLLHCEGQIAFIKLFIMKLPGVTFCVRRSHWQNCINPGSFILLISSVYGWQLLSVLHMFLSNGILSYTDIQLLQQRCHLGWMKTWSFFLTGVLLRFLLQLSRNNLWTWCHSQTLVSAQAISLSSHPFLCPSHNLWWQLHSLLVSVFWTWCVVQGVCLLPR